MPARPTMTPSLLLTQCLQNDFVQPIGRYEPIPNQLHVGHAEARRLMGEDPAQGPVARVMRWAHATPDDRLRLVHIRDWHDADDPAQRTHLRQFGPHCLRGTSGAAFAFPAADPGAKAVPVIDSLTLNDFHGTSLAAVLAPYVGQPARVGLMGVWTEAKVSFLCYELVTRYPEFAIAVCSALTASSSRQHHFQALDALARLLGVRVLDSVGEFVAFLGGEGADVPLPPPAPHPRVSADGLTLADDDQALVRYLFRDCRDVRLRALDGGFSGNVVAAAESVDLLGHEQVPHVVKIGPRGPMGQERTAFERIQEVLGNNAPHVSDFADLGERGAIKYRYAAMGGAIATTFQKAYQAGLPLPEVARVLDTVFGEQLGRLTKAATLEACDLLAYYQFDPRWAASVRQKVEALLGGPAQGRTIEVLPGLAVPNVCHFYESTLARLPRRPGDQCWFAFQHGDLNGANIILDGHGNVWLIDFFHTHRGHVLRDLVKLENDLCYIWTPLADDAALREACALTDKLAGVADLAAPLPAPPQPIGEPLQRCVATLRMLRAFTARLVQSDRDPFQLFVAQLRYAVHTLGFDESTPRQKRWALYAAGRCVERITAALRRSTALRLDWLAPEHAAPGRLALTLLPGRRDLGREVDADLAVLREAGVTHVCCLVPEDELTRYGVPDLLARYAAAGVDVHHLPILDQQVASVADVRAAVAWVDAALRAGRTVVAHCVGGLGRTGLLAACWLRARGLDAAAALAAVRAARSPRAVETPAQERFVAAFGG